ncbi:hypothetical protein Q7P37_001123 [Cladosporium fusiforme]
MPPKRKRSATDPGVSDLPLPIASKPKLRETYSAAPKYNQKKHHSLLTTTNHPSLKPHVLFLFIGPHFDLTSLHTSLLPARVYNTLEVLSQHHRAWAFPETTPETFELYRLFLYTSKLFSHVPSIDQDHADNGHAEAHEDREWMRLANAYLLGLKLGDEKFCNAVVDGLLEKVGEADRYPTGLATEVYTHTAPGDKLRALIVDLHVWKGQGTGVRAPHDDASGPPEFTQDVLHGLTAAGGAVYSQEVPMPWEVEGCEKYHVHGETERCAGNAGKKGGNGKKKLTLKMRGHGWTAKGKKK